MGFPPKKKKVVDVNSLIDDTSASSEVDVMSLIDDGGEKKNSSRQSNNGGIVSKNSSQNIPQPQDDTPLFQSQPDPLTINGLIQPVGTYKKPAPVTDFIQQLKQGGKVENGVITIHDNTQPSKKAKQPDIKEAIDNSVNQFISKMVKPTKDEISFQTKAITDAYKNGDLVPSLTEDGKSVLKRGVGFWDSLVNGIEQVNKNNLENEYFSSLNKDEKIRYLNAKQQAPEAFNNEEDTAPSGILGQAGNFIGENVSMLAKGAVGAMAATVAAPEAAAAGALTGNFGAFLGLANDIGTSGYKNAYERTYYAIKKNNPEITDEEAADKAQIAGLTGEAAQLGTGAVLSSGSIGQLNGKLQVPEHIAQSASDILNKSLVNVLAKEAPKFALTSGGSSLIEGAVRASLGTGETASDVLSEAGEATKGGYKTGLIFGVPHLVATAMSIISNPTSAPSYLRPQMENVAASMPVSERENFLRQAVDKGILTTEDSDNISRKLTDFAAAKEPINQLPISEEKKAAITGKILQQNKLNAEREQLLKYGSSFSDRVGQIDTEVNGIHDDIAKMYSANDVLEVERDGLTGEPAIASISDAEIKPTYKQAEPYILPLAAREHTQSVIDKVNNADYINEGEINKATDTLYETLDKAPEVAHLIEPLISKLENYEFTTKTENSTVTETVPVEVAKPTRQPISVSKNLEQWEGNKATVTNADGSTVDGQIKIEDGKYYLYNNEGQQVAALGEKSITDRDISLPSNEENPNPIGFDKDGNVSSITLQLNKVDKENGGVVPDKTITVNFKDKEKALDYAIQLRAEQIGEIPQPEFETIYQEIEKQVPVEILKNSDNNKSVSNETSNTEATDTGNKVNAANEGEQEVNLATNTEPTASAKENIINEPGNGTTTNGIGDPLQKDEGQTKGQANKGSVQPSSDEIGQGNAIGATPILENTNTTDNAIVQSNMPNEEVPKQSSEQEHARVSTQPDKETPQTNDSNSSIGGKESPKKRQVNVNNENTDEWTAIRKSRLQEIDKVRSVFEKETNKSWSDIQQKSLEDVTAEYPDKDLYDAVRAKTEEIASKYDDPKVDYNPTAKDLAVIQEFKRQTEKKINQSRDRLTSNDDIVRQAAILENENYQNDLSNIGKALHTREAGTAFGFRQSESRLDENYGLQIRRMELMKAQGGAKLTDEQMAWTQEQWTKEKEIIQKEQQIRENILREEFADRINKLKKGLQDKGQASASPSKEKTLSQKGKDIADRIRQLKTPTGAAKLDFTLGGWDLAVEGIAKLVEGGATIAEAIDKLINDKKIAFKEPNGKELFQNKLISEIGKSERRESAGAKIQDLANKGETEITMDMVSKGLIKDFVDAHISDKDGSETFNEAFSDIKKILPDATKENLLEAYLRQGDFRSETKRDIETSIATKQRELNKVAKDELTAEQEQKIKLKQAKADIESDIAQLKRKLNDRDYEEREPLFLKKEDASLIKLQREKADLETIYRNRKRELAEKNKSWGERSADFIRGLYVAALIGSPKTLLKVGAMAVMRPLSEAVTKRTFGKLFDAFFPGISEAAKRGGESSSIRAVAAGFGAFFRQMGAEKMQRKFENSKKKYEESVIRYEDYKKSKDQEPEVLYHLEKDMNNKLLSAMGNLSYQFIGGSSIQDAMKALVHRANNIEGKFGGIEEESIKDGNWLDKTNYVLNFIGRSHSALKTFSGRFSFAAGFMARMEAAVKEGSITSDKIIEIGHESYLDFERGKYQQGNYISDKWNQITKTINQRLAKNPEWNKYNKVAEALLRSEVAITRVPVNILHEAVMEYTLGVFRSLQMTAKVFKEAKKEAQLDVLLKGDDFKNRVKEIVSSMDEKQAATIVRSFRKGGIGLGLYAFAAVTGLMHFGSFPHLGQKKKKDENRLKGDELNPGQIEVNGTKLGEVASGIIDHTPALWPTFMGLGIASIYHDNLRKRKSQSSSAWNALYTHLKIIEGGIPQSKIVQPTKIAEAAVQASKKRLTDYGLIEEEEK